MTDAWLSWVCVCVFSQLIGRINKVGVLSPRFDVKVSEYENWVNNVLPSRQVRHTVPASACAMRRIGGSMRRRGLQ